MYQCVGIGICIGKGIGIGLRFTYRILVDH